MANVLDAIIQRKLCDVQNAREDRPPAVLRELIAQATEPRDFFGAATCNIQPDTTRIIAEIKRKSPSAGAIWLDQKSFDPVDIARQYHDAGAAAISCLTDEEDFGGDLSFIQPIREAVPLPVLRKDFVVDTYQVLEARAAGADAVLLIAECLNDSCLSRCHALAQDLGMASLIETHSEVNLRRVLELIQFGETTRTLLGINNRNLELMRTDLGHTARMLETHQHHVPPTRFIVAESGIKKPKDLKTLRRSGVIVALVGESLMATQEPGKALRALLA